MTREKHAEGKRASVELEIPQPSHGAKRMPRPQPYWIEWRRRRRAHKSAAGVVAGLLLVVFLDGAAVLAAVFAVLAGTLAVLAAFLFAALVRAVATAAGEAAGRGERGRTDGQSQCEQSRGDPIEHTISFRERDSIHHYDSEHSSERIGTRERFNRPAFAGRPLGCPVDRGVLSTVARTTGAD